MSAMQAIFGPMRLLFLVLTPACVLLGIGTAVWQAGRVSVPAALLAFIGAVAGLDPQRAVLLEKHEDSYHIVGDEDLENSERGYVHTHFSADDTLFLIAQEDGCVFLSGKTGNSGTLPTLGVVRSFITSDDGSITAISMNNEGTWFTRFSSPGTRLFSINIMNGETCLVTPTGSMIVGIGDHLAGYSLGMR